MNSFVTDIIGWVPAVILPTAAILQLVKLGQQKSADGVSLTTWLLFGFANVGLYVFTEKYWALQSIIGLLGTAVINFVIVGVILSLRRSAKSVV